MDKSKIDIENWEKVAPEYIKYTKTERNGYLKHLLYGSLYSNILTMIDGVKGKSILDAGCGEGRLARIIASRGATVDGCDSSKTMIEEAKGMELKKRQGISYFVHDLTKPFPSNHSSYDLIVCNLVLFNIFHFDTVINNLSAVCKEGGQLVISLLHPCFNTSQSQWFNLRFIGYNGGKITFSINKSYKEHSSYKKDYLFKHNAINYYHRPIESYAKSLKRGSFLIENLSEPTLGINEVYDDKTYHHHYLPRFLIISATKIDRQGILT